MVRRLAPAASAVAAALVVLLVALLAGDVLGDAAGRGLSRPARTAPASFTTRWPADSTAAPSASPTVTATPTVTPTVTPSASRTRSSTRPTATARPRLDPRCLVGTVICASKTDRRLRYLVDGRAVLSLAARFGAPRTPTREGTFAVLWKDRDHWSARYESDMPFSLFFTGGQAIHYSADFAAVGYAGASHGCVNLRDRTGAQRLFDLAEVGTRVVVYR